MLDFAIVYTKIRQHTMQKLHKMSCGSAHLGSYSFQRVILPKLLVSVINLDFIKVTYENRDISPILAAGVQKMRFYDAFIQCQLSGCTTHEE